MAYRPHTFLIVALRSPFRRSDSTSIHSPIRPALSPFESACSTRARFRPVPHLTKRHGDDTRQPAGIRFRNSAHLGIIVSTSVVLYNTTRIERPCASVPKPRAASRSCRAARSLLGIFQLLRFTFSAADPNQEMSVTVDQRSPAVIQRSNLGVERFREGLSGATIGDVSCANVFGGGEAYRSERLFDYPQGIRPQNLCSVFSVS